MSKLTKVASQYLHKVAEAPDQAYVDQYMKGRDQFKKDATWSWDSLHLLDTFNKSKKYYHITNSWQKEPTKPDGSTYPWPVNTIMKTPNMSAFFHGYKDQKWSKTLENFRDAQAKDMLHAWGIEPNSPNYTVYYNYLINSGKHNHKPKNNPKPEIPETEDPNMQQKLDIGGQLMADNNSNKVWNIG